MGNEQSSGRRGRFSKKLKNKKPTTPSVSRQLSELSVAEPSASSASGGGGLSRRNVAEIVDNFWVDAVEPNRNAVAEALFVQLFGAHPEYLAVFSQNSRSLSGAANARRQMSSLMRMLTELLRQVTRSHQAGTKEAAAALDERLGRLGRMHAALRIPPSAFAHMTEAFVSALSLVLSEEVFTPTTKSAIFKLLNLTGSVMAEVTREHAQKHDLRDVSCSTKVHNADDWQIMAPDGLFNGFLKNDTARAYFELFLLYHGGSQDLTMYRDMAMWELTDDPVTRVRLGKKFVQSHVTHSQSKQRSHLSRQTRRALVESVEAHERLIAESGNRALKDSPIAQDSFFLDAKEDLTEELNERFCRFRTSAHAQALMQQLSRAEQEQRRGVSVTG